MKPSPKSIPAIHFAGVGTDLRGKQRNRKQRKKKRQTRRKEKKGCGWCYLLNLDALLFPQGYWQQLCFPEMSHLLPVVHWWPLNLQYPLAVCQGPAGSEQGFPLCLHLHCSCIPQHRAAWAEQQEWKQGWRERAQRLLPGLQHCIGTRDKRLRRVHKQPANWAKGKPGAWKTAGTVHYCRDLTWAQQKEFWFSVWFLCELSPRSTILKTMTNPPNWVHLHFPPVTQIKAHQLPESPGNSGSA